MHLVSKFAELGFFGVNLLKNMIVEVCQISPMDLFVKELERVDSGIDLLPLFKVR